MEPLQKPCDHCGGTGQVMDDKAIGKQLKKMRLALGIKQGFVAERMEFSVPYISELERGTRVWTAEKIENYKIAIGVSSK